ncbi:MAG: ATP-binding cassette domain-containing protein [Tannerellaceae bacterium]|jgi:ABC-2 type transport system ATP-binding protein|nr:ATP-binding cassette domain-containing protein [Tannerellaceae bacterium]
MIEICNLLKRYKGQTALDNISFSIPKGCIFGFLGPNGAGKTTLIRIIAGLLVQDAGCVLFDEQPLNRLNRKRIGYLPEERGLYKNMKIGEQIIYLAVFKGLTKQDAEKKLRQWFDKLEIADWWNKKPDELSKGMQQKVQFIVSVIHQPDILILDEPLSGLDPINRETLGKEIVEFNQSGKTVILSTHDMNSVEQFCDEVMLINKGKLLLSGKVYETKQNKQSYIYEFQFKQNNEFFSKQCDAVNGYIISNKKGNYKVQLKNEEDVERILSNILIQKGLTSFSEIHPSMNDIFIDYVTNANQLL